MNLQKYLLGTLVGAVVSFIVAGALYGMLLKDFFASHAGAQNVMKPEPDVVMVGIGHIFLGLLLTVILGRWAGIKTFSSGAQAGAIIGALISLTFNFTMLGTTYQFDGIGTALIDSIVSVILVGVAGGAVGWTLGRE